MSTRVVERVDDWDQEPFSGGYRALQERADVGFSGVFRANGAELFMTRGTVVGIRHGDVGDFEAAEGTVSEAPTDALPLLAIMQDRSDEVRAKYYTEDTGIREVDQTLEDGGFTGYVELSENVLSGDYYLVYHQGNSMSVGFVGNTERLITGDEAFETTDDEVGIYKVRPVDIEPIEIPEPVEPEPDPGGATAAGAAADETEADDPFPDAPAEEAADAATDPTDAVADAPESAHPTEPTEPAESTPVKPTGTAGPAEGAQADQQSEPTGDHPGETAGDVGAGAEPTEQAAPTEQSSPPSEPDDVDAGDTTTSSATDAAAGAGIGAAATGEERSVDSGTETQREPTSDEPTGTTSRETGGEATAAERRRASESLTDRSGADVGTSEPADTSPEPSPTTPEGSADSTRTTESPVTETRQADVSADTPSRTEQDAVDQQGAGQQAAATTAGRESTTDAPGQLETKSIPSLDPQHTVAPSQGEQSRRDTPGRNEGEPTATASTQQTQPQQEDPQQEEAGQEQPQSEPTEQAASEPAEPADQQAETQADQQEAAAQKSTSSAGSQAAERIEELQELLEERETELNRLEADLQTAESERESLRRELDQVKQERDDLKAEVEKLESEMRRLEEEHDLATDAQQRMTPQEALTGTDLFVRYDSKGDATLAKARDSGLRKQDVAGNLQLEKHTQFESDVAAVGGREYAQFIEDTVAYEFAHWAVYDLLFEIQSTGHTDTLADLYEALPKINRIELNGAVNATYVEDGEEVQSTESFDVVFRERMGDPLLVANINESRQGATEGMMEQLITAAERVGQTTDQFAAAFLVTESFFEPEALETVEESTRGGILSRDKRKSYVNLSRKNGYHLCLVEARNQNFHLEVPEL